MFYCMQPYLIKHGRLILELNTIHLLKFCYLQGGIYNFLLDVFCMMLKLEYFNVYVYWTIFYVS